MAAVVSDVTTQFTSVASLGIVGGFALASAIAWMDLVRWLIAQIVQVSKNGGQYYLLSAIFTTLLSVIVFLAMKRLTGVTPPQPVLAVTGR